MQKIILVLRLQARLAFAAMIIALPLRWRIVITPRPIDGIYKDYTDFLLFAPDILMFATLVLWLFLIIVERKRIGFGTPSVSLSLAGLTLTAIITCFSSLDPSLSVYHSLRLISLGALYLFVVNEIRTLSWVTLPLAIQISIQAFIGIEQFHQQHSLGLQSLGEYELDPVWSGVSVVINDGNRVLRAYGLTDHPNILGGCLALAMILHAACFSDERWHGKLLILIAFPLSAIALLFTFSRAAVGALALGIVFVALSFWLTRQLVALKQVAFLLGIAAIIVLPIAWQNANVLGVRSQGAAFASNDPLEIRSLAERTALNSAANRIFIDHPILGIGIGALAESVKANFPNFEFYPQPAHIALLDAASETGIFGALFYFALIAVPWIALGAYRSRIKWRATLIGTSALLLAITTIGFFDYYTWLLVPGRLWQWTAWGLWSVVYQTAGTQ